MKIGKRCFVLAALPMLVSSVKAVDYQELETPGNRYAATYNNRFNAHYEKHNIIEKLGLDKEMFAESIENIRKLGQASVKNYINKKAAGIHIFDKRDVYVPGNPKNRAIEQALDGINNDLLITTGRGQDEDIVDYFNRLDVSNFNYVILENLMQMILLDNGKNTTKDLLDNLVLKMNQRACLNERLVMGDVLERIHKSRLDVEKYISAGALDEFLNSFKNEGTPAPSYAMGSIEVREPAEKTYLDENNLANKMLEETNEESAAPAFRLDIANFGANNIEQGLAEQSA